MFAVELPQHAGMEVLPSIKTHWLPTTTAMKWS